MKAMILVVSPKEGVNLLNGDLSVLTRKKFPKDYVGWVYIYVTKDSKKGWCMISFRKSRKHYYQPFSKTACYSPLDEYVGNGNVVARFWCDKVEEHRPFFHWCIEKETCLIRKVKAIHIANLEIFDKPKEISEFYKIVHDDYKIKDTKTFINNSIKVDRKTDLLPLTHAPRSGYCYIEM